MSKKINEASFEKEQLPIETFFRTLSDKTEIRIVKILHPKTGQPVTAIPYLDLAKVFSYDEESIRQMIYRSPWVKKHSITCIIQAVDGKYRAQLCLLRPAAIGIFMKLEPGRCKDKDIASHIDERQEELIFILEDALTTQKSLTVDEYKKVRLVADLILRIEKTSDSALRERLYEHLERLENRPIPRPAQVRLPYEGKEAQ